MQSTNQEEKTLIRNTPAGIPSQAAHKRKYKAGKGFTLLEILIVLAILGVMAAALIPSIESAMHKSHDTQLVVNLTTLDSAARIYAMENGRAPTDIKELVDGKYVPSKEYEDIILKKSSTGSKECEFEGTLSSGEVIRSSELGKPKKEGGNG